MTGKACVEEFKSGEPWSCSTWDGGGGSPQASLGTCQFLAVQHTAPHFNSSNAVEFLHWADAVQLRHVLGCAIARDYMQVWFLQPAI